MAPGAPPTGTALDVVAAGPRDLTAEELALLETAVARVRDLIGPLEPAGIGALWSRLLDVAEVTDTEPARFVGMAIGTALLDVEPSARWVACLGPNGVTPAVVSDARPSAPVLVVADAMARWHERADGWVGDYLDRAVAHLTHTPVDGDDDAPWYATVDDLPEPPTQQVRDLATVAVDLALQSAGDQPQAFALLPGPDVTSYPFDATDRPRVRAWACEWAGESACAVLAVVWVDPPEGVGRHATARTGSLVVEAGERGRPGMASIQEYVLGPHGPEVVGPAAVGQIAPLL
ncbi:MAG: hypothetical protein KJ792_04755 [Actinobacteria bacterium]|nr:hypothetical protein [Actinomycetota bacterium]